MTPLFQFCHTSPEEQSQAPREEETVSESHNHERSFHTVSFQFEHRQPTN
uniref:Uncharacterized protein n=1 Tax=Arundo donax TaxID=35708 RepID=A0A0A9FBP8_ARUDO